MSGCNSNQNYSVNRSSSRVLNPPGGRSSFSLGGDDYDPPPRQNQGRRQQEQRVEYEYEPRRSPRYKPPPAVAPGSRPREVEDYNCSIPGLQDHYRTLAQKNGAPYGGGGQVAVSRPPRDRDYDRDSKPPRDRDYDRDYERDRDSREAASSMKAHVRHAEEDSMRRRDPSPYERESGGRRGRDRAESPIDSGPSAGERALMEAKRMAIERSEKDKAKAGRGSGRRGGGRPVPIAAPAPAPAPAPVVVPVRRQAPPRDAYDNVLSSDPPPRRRGGAPTEQDSRKGSVGNRSQADGGVKLIGGMDRRGPAIPPGGKSSLSLGWD